MSSAPAAAAPKKANGDLVQRGIYGRDVRGSATFIGLRAADPFLHYSILKYGFGASIITTIGLSTLPAGPPNTGTFLDALGLSPYRLIIFGMTTVTAARQIAWTAAIGREALSPVAAVQIGLFNTFLNALGTYAFICAETSASMSSGASFPQTPLLLGSALFVAGSVIETVADVQKKTFKDDKTNTGLLCTNGLWSISRHANYFGYTLWRVGFAMATGGYGLAVAFGAFHTWFFYSNSIPVLEEYLASKVSP